MGRDGDGPITTIPMPDIIRTRTLAIIRIQTIKLLSIARLRLRLPRPPTTIALIRKATTPTFKIAAVAGSLFPRRRPLHGRPTLVLWTAQRLLDDSLAVSVT